MVLKKASKEAILDSVYITTIAQDYGINLELISSGNFTHRCRCPSKDHKHGSERTSSLYIDAKNNNFYCFGCGATSNAIDFYMLCEDVDFSQAMAELSKFVDPEKAGKFRAKNSQNIYSTLLKISTLFRKSLRGNKEDYEWMFKLMKLTDLYISEIERDDVASAKKLLRNIKKKLESRYGEI